MWKAISVTVAFVATALILAGCCSIIHGTSQEVGVSSSPTSSKLFVNGSPAGTTPATLNLSRDGSHVIRIEHDGYQPFEMVLTKSVSGWVWGNIVFGGIIGLAIDAIDGAIYKLSPEQVSAQLLKREGDTLRVNMVKGPPEKGEKIGQLEQTPAEKLKKLKDLKDQDLITAEEYEAKRKDLIDQLN